jgi:hypothetical protein
MVTPILRRSEKRIAVDLIARFLELDVETGKRFFTALDPVAESSTMYNGRLHLKHIYISYLVPILYITKARKQDVYHIMIEGCSSFEFESINVVLNF